MIAPCTRIPSALVSISFSRPFCAQKIRLMCGYELVRLSWPRRTESRFDTLSTQIVLLSSITSIYWYQRVDAVQCPYKAVQGTARYLYSVLDHCAGRLYLVDTKYSCMHCDIRGNEQVGIQSFVLDRHHRWEGKTKTGTFRLVIGPSLAWNRLKMRAS